MPKEMVFLLKYILKIENLAEAYMKNEQYYETERIEHVIRYNTLAQKFEYALMTHNKG